MSSIRVGLTAANTGTAAQTLTAPGSPSMADTTLASVLAMTAGTASGTLANPAQHDTGATDGTNHRALATLGEHNTAPASTDNGGRHGTDAVILHTATGSNARDALAAHTSFGAGTHVLNWSDLPGAADLISHLFFGGSEVQVALRELTCSATIGGTASVTGLPFAPNLVICFGRGTGAFPTDTAFTSRSRVSGVAVKTPSGTIEQFGYGDVTTNNTVSCRSIFRTNRVGQRLQANGNLGAPELTSWNSDGATFTTRDDNDAVTLAMLFVYLPRCRLRALATPFSTATTGNKAVDVDFPARVVHVFATALTSADTQSTVAPCSRYSSGWHDEVGNTACVGFQFEDGAGTSVSRSFATSSHLARVLTNAGGDAWTLTWVSNDTEGVTLNVGSTDGGAYQFGLLIISPDYLDATSANDVAAPDFTATGTLTNPATSSNDVAAPDFNATGTITMLGTAAMAVGAPDFTGTGTEAESGTSANDVAAPDFNATGTITMLGTAAMAVAAPNFNAMGTASGTCHLEVGAPDCTATGTITMLGTAAMAVAAPDFTATGVAAFTVLPSPVELELVVPAVARLLAQAPDPVALAMLVASPFIEGAFVLLELRAELERRLELPSGLSDQAELRAELAAALERSASVQ